MKFKSLILVLVVLLYLTSGFKSMCSRKPQPFIGFELNQSNIDSCNTSDLELFLSFFEEYPNGLVELDGYIGATEDSTLAIRRAESVRDFFLNKGISSDCFQIENYGKKNAAFDIEYQLHFENCGLRREALLGNRLVSFSILSFDSKTE